MSKLFCPLNGLEAYVADAVSKPKKVVASVAAAIVGIRLFTAPIEFAQAQVLSHFGVPGLL